MIEHPNITVLYVDDEKDNLFVFKANFNRTFEVITSISPVLALEELAANQDKIIVVISDMRMPEMSGLDFIRKAREKYDNIFYYILTGYGQSPEIEAALTEKVIEKSFAKPFDTEEIEASILEAVGGLRKN